MTQQDIRTLLEQPYDRERWKKLVTALFPGRDVFANPVLHEPGTLEDRKHVQRIYQFGEAKLKDGELVGLYEAHLQPSADLARNRASVRKAVEKLVKWGGLSGALISFVDPGKRPRPDSSGGIWRFSFYSNTLSAEGTWESAHRKRYTYLLGEGEKCRTAAEQFDWLAEKAGQVTLKELLEAFSVEKVSKAFFREYKEHYQDFVQHLTGKRMVKKAGKWEEKVMHAPSPKLAAYFNGNEKDARDFCKKLMGRLVFLYFLQKKRWLGASGTDYTDGDPDFVFGLFRAQGGDTFYPNVLVPLFFETLNAERTGDDYRMPDGALRKVPFLNGGLFDMDVLDRKTRLLTFPPELFSNPAKADEEKERGFLDFLNAYNFTVHEAGPEEQTLAVDPEMLGHIFENLLEDNKDKGAFYTPKEIVHYMCQESLVQYLKNYLVRARGEEVKKEGSDGLEDQLRRFLQHGEWAALSPYSGVLLKALRNVKVCDPAIGSGAFPMGILHEIFQCVERIHDLSPDETESIWELSGWNPAEVKLRIIQHSIYGVDIERGAVDIARLRFWLSIIVDERAPRTLPNLDYKIVVGDSLLGKFKRSEEATAEVLEIDWSLRATTDRTKEIRAIIDTLHDKTELFFRDQTQATKKKLEKDIRALKIELLIKQLELDRDKYREKNPLPGGFAELTKSQQSDVLRIKKRLSEFEVTLGQLRTLLRQTEKPLVYFDWQLDFPEVLNPNVVEEPGFDIVLANPPYMRVQQVQKAMPQFKAALERKYTNAEGAWDLANVFFERAVQLVKSSGNCCFIFPHKFFNSDSASVFRDYLMAGAYVDRILHFGANQVFNEADTYTCIAQFSKAHNTGFQFSKVPFKQGKGTYIDWFAPYLDSTDHFNVIDYSSLARASKVYGGNTWIFFASPVEYATFEELYSQRVRLEDMFEDVFQGIATSKDELYIGELLADSGKHLELSFGEYGNHKVEKALFKPMLKGSDVHRYETLNHSKYVFFPYLVDQMKDKAAVVDLKSLKRDYPLTYRYVSENEEAFKKRESGKAAKMEHWHGYIYPKSLTKFDKVKLSSMEICSSRMNVTLNGSGIYHSTTVYSWIKRAPYEISYEFILSIVNSSLMWWFLYNTGDTLQGDARRVKSNYVNPFPLPGHVGRKCDEFIADRVRRVMEQKRQGVNTTALEREIDVLVCKLYGLSWEQAKVVDLQLALSQAEYDAVELPAAEGPLGASGNSVGGAPGVTGLTDEGTLFGQDLEQPLPPQRPADRATQGAPGNGQASAAILTFLRANKGWHGKSAILEGTDVDAGDWNAAVKELVDAGKVERQGEKKGAKYRVR